MASVAAGKAVSACPARHEPRHGRLAVPGDAGAGLGHLRFQRGVPVRVARAVLEEAVALPHGLLVGQRRLAMVGEEAQAGAVEEAAARLGPFGPEPVHGGHEPQDGDQRARSSWEAALPSIRTVRASPGKRLRSRPRGPVAGQRERPPRPSSPPPRRAGRPPRRPARRSPRPGDRYDTASRGSSCQIRRSPDWHGPSVEVQPRAGVAAELRQREVAQVRLRHTRIGWLGHPRPLTPASAMTT
jgi:hypothetical protein